MWNSRLVPLLAASLVSLGLSACHNDDEAPPPNVEGPVPLPTYSIGGTVTGATGALTLQNTGNQSSQAVAGAGVYSFATQIAQGASYTVVVAVPPSGQSCTVTNATGTMGMSNVTNINVTCTNNGLTLGGTVSGLAPGATLGLRASTDVMSSNLTVTANGAFTFPQAFQPNAEYEVIVVTQPANQTCSVANGSGDFANTSISNIAVTCINSSASARNWSTAGNIATDSDVQDTNGIRTPRVAYDAAGNALAVWVADKQGAAGTEMMWSRRLAGGTWSAPAKIPDWAPPPPDPSLGLSLKLPVLAVAPNGNAVAAWRVVSFNGDHVMASTFTPAGGWTNPVFLWRKHPDMAAGAEDLGIAADSAGNTLVVWAAVGVVFYNRYTPGTGWVELPTVEGLGRPVSQLVGPALEPEMALNSAGQAVAIWRQGQQTFPDPPRDYDLWSSRYDMTSDTWTAPQQVEDGDRDQIYGKSVVIDSTGAATALWSDFDGDRLHVRAARLVGNTWTLPSIVETGNTSSTGFAKEPHAVVDANGNVLAVWQQGDIDSANFVASRYVPGTVWGGQQVIGKYVGSRSVIFSTELRVAGNLAGHVVVAWTLPSCILAENVPCPTDLHANEYNPLNGNWGAEEVIDKEYLFPGEISGDVSTPWLAVDAAGNATAVWDQDRGQSGDGIRYSRFE